MSVLELAFNQVHRKELVFRETIEIFTESEAGGVAEEAPKPASRFKNAGQALAFAGAATDIDLQTQSKSKGAESVVDFGPSQTKGAPQQASRNNTQRTVALSLALLLAGSSATWAFTPEATRDWWVASIVQDDTQAYTAYLEKYPDSPYREKALYRKAERSALLADLREYQESFPEGRFRDKVAVRVAALETQALEKVIQQPNRSNIQQFASTFPESEQLYLVKQAAEARTENRKELVSAVEQAYVASAKARPSAKIVSEYLREFPNRDSLDAISAAVSSMPEVMAKVQPELEEAYLKKMEQNLTAAKAEAFLDKFPEPLKKERFEQVVAKKPEIRKKAATKMRRIQELKSIEQKE